MAVYDLAHRRLCVRVVYDGPAAAGKTTNVRQLAGAFASQRWGELETREELAGRTLWFDWLQIRAGVVWGLPLVCQIVTVPGQAGLTPRRRRLLASADVVVFVCDSTADGLERSREAVRLAVDDGATVPRVLQANQQDRAGAVAPEEVAAAIGVDASAVIGAIARDGIGVVDTFVAAVRALTRSLEDRVRRGDLRVEAAAMEDSRSVRRRLEALAIDREDAAEMVLEEAAAQLLGDIAVEIPRGRRSLVPAGLVGAPLPRSDAPSGFVWPADTGRATLAALGGLDGLRDRATLDLDGRVVVEIDGHVLTTSTGQQFDDPETARQALVRAARERTQLEALLVAGTVLTVREGSDGTCWLWTIAPDLPRWADRWRAASGDGEREGLLEDLAAASVDGALLALRRGLAISSDLGDYRLQDGGLRYAGELSRCDADDRSAAEILVALADAACAVGADRRRFVAAALRELERRGGGGDAEVAMTRALEAHPS